MHEYALGSYASDGAHKWLQYSKVGLTTPSKIAMQMQGFVVSGCCQGIENPKVVCINFLFFQYITLTLTVGLTPHMYNEM
jgi:hypothetical protein